MAFLYDRLKAVRATLVRRLGVRQICPYPFSKMDVPSRDFVPCCPQYFEPEYYKISPGSDLWNGEQAQELRRRILNNDYSFCRTSKCKVVTATFLELLIAPNLYKDAKISRKNLLAMWFKKTRLPDGPSVMAITADPRCNLACPSCRPSLITTLDSASTKSIAVAERTMELYRKSLKIVSFASDGEVFFSPWLRNTLKNTTKLKFPKLTRINILTNGLLLSEKNLNQLKPGSNNIRSVSVSIDAGNREVYAQVRGGCWDTLMKQLLWMKEERKRRKVSFFSINFTVRKANYATMEEFVQLGQSLDVDMVRFTQFEPWDRRAIQDYESEAVHLPSHPDHKTFKQVYERIKQIPLVRLEIPIA